MVALVAQHANEVAPRTKCSQPRHRMLNEPILSAALPLSPGTKHEFNDFAEIGRHACHDLFNDAPPNGNEKEERNTRLARLFEARENLVKRECKAIVGGKSDYVRRVAKLGAVN